jgi:nuclear transport factor 2 (NTF2) superfamily protein
VWRNRDQFVVGREEIKEFLACKWRNEHNYRLRKEVFAFSGNKM